VGTSKSIKFKALFPAPQKKEKICASWVRAKSPHWFNRTSIIYGHPFLL
jgi:hypothetical protein